MSEFLSSPLLDSFLHLGLTLSVLFLLFRDSWLDKRVAKLEGNETA